MSCVHEKSDSAQQSGLVVLSKHVYHSLAAILQCNGQLVHSYHHVYLLWTISVPSTSSLLVVEEVPHPIPTGKQLSLFVPKVLSYITKKTDDALPTETVYIDNKTRTLALRSYLYYSTRGTDNNLFLFKYYYPLRFDRNDELEKVRARSLLLACAVSPELNL